MIKAKKRFGQNFLKDESVTKKIIQSMPNDNRLIVEIGPGLGDLTKELLRANRRVAAFEIDLELCGYLQKSFRTEIEKKRLGLVCGDVLKSWEHGSLADEKYHLIANLPYYIATNIILKALEDSRCVSVLVMTQKEVAEKFSAKSGEKSFSALSVLANSISKTQILFDVDKDSFDPPPKVTSAVMKLKKFREYIDKDLFSNQKELEDFKCFLRAAFRQPRKMLLKNLQNLYKKDILLKQFELFEIPSNIRPHQLEILKYHLLFKSCSSLS